MKTTKQPKMILSKRYEGVYSKEIINKDSNGPKQLMMYIAYKNSNGNYSKYKVGLKSETINEKFCYELRQKELTKIRLKSDDPSLCNRDKIILFREIMEDYFKIKSIVNVEIFKTLITKQEIMSSLYLVKSISII